MLYDVRMSKIFNMISGKLNLSSPKNYFLVLLACVLTTCILSDIISVVGFNISWPELIDNYEYEIRLQTFITSSLLSCFLFAITISLVKHVEELRKELSEQLKYDHLTGVLSREAFLNEIKEDEAPHKINAFFLIDADFFKRINDTHGHQVGDKALVVITHALKEGVRSSDYIGRIGGEEFGAYLKNIDKKRALEIAERLRLNVKEANATFGYPDIDLSVSIGAVVYEENLRLPDLMRKADILLYKAKENGRNRVEHIFLNKALSA